MTIRVEHELHERRRSRNTGVGLILVGFVGIVFALTVVKVLNLGDIRQMERFDHVARPQLEPAAIEAATGAAPAGEEGTP
ncbi:hypothetical protein [Roseisalinus antarcticus]|uniref:Cytochrome C oxidase assembly protein n=1 Tax=Roseisalinus antarcticus TaxID=254357 RepID=A0A1Y5SWQ6_9RHOB|nr:hypothetical protein [Roseisalinus antarcticus]SLN50466.1 hypothetical protein ROA7023_02184 [Roseisalinus antarcticus]